MHRYNPFSRQEIEGVPSMLGHRPPILGAPLTPLAWSTVPGGKSGDADKVRGGKRTRLEHAPDVPSAVPAGPPPRVVERMVERVVEKIITVPSDERISILGLPPLVDDRVRNLVNFILLHVTSPDVEVEAKLGTLIEKNQNQRACELLPVLCETPIRSEIAAENTRFESSVHQVYFAYLNAELNRRVDATTGEQDEESRVCFVRHREIDLFWGNGVRETRRLLPTTGTGEQQYQTVRVQRKTRLGDLNFVCPLSVFDVRYSASVETDVSAPPQNVPDPSKRRVKDRMSYRFDSLSVDITTVQTYDASANLHKHNSFEVEVEIDASANLFAEVEKYRAGDPSSKVFRIATSLVNTVRLLMEEMNKAANASDGTALQGQVTSPGQQLQHHRPAIGHQRLQPPQPLEMSPHR
jgi:polynucleotide 5'-triphosphatase